MDFELYHKYPPGDPILVDKIVCHLKAQGIFDNFRKECLSDVDTKPAYQNLRQRVDGSVAGYLAGHKWKPDLNKNQLRESLRKYIQNGGFLEVGVERIVDQVVNPKIGQVFLPRVRDVVFEGLGLKEENNSNVSDRPASTSYMPPSSSTYTTASIPNQIEVSKENAALEKEPMSAGDCGVKKEDDESEIIQDNEEIVTLEMELEPVIKTEEATNHLETQTESRSNDSFDSRISGISDLTSVKSTNSSKDLNASDDDNNFGKSVNTDDDGQKEDQGDEDNIDKSMPSVNGDDVEDSQDKIQQPSNDNYEKSYTNFSFLSEFTTQVESVEIDTDQIGTSVVECVTTSENNEEDGNGRDITKNIELNYDSDSNEKYRKEIELQQSTDIEYEYNDDNNDEDENTYDEISRGLNSDHKEGSHFEETQSETDVERFDSTSNEMKFSENTNCFDDETLQKSSDDESSERHKYKVKEELARTLETERNYRKEKERKHHSKHKHSKDYHYNSSSGESREDRKHRKSSHLKDKPLHMRDDDSHSSSVEDKSRKTYDSLDKHRRSKRGEESMFDQEETSKSESDEKNIHYKERHSRSWDHKRATKEKTHGDEYEETTFDQEEVSKSESNEKNKYKERPRRSREHKHVTEENANDEDEEANKSESDEKIKYQEKVAYSHKEKHSRSRDHKKASKEKDVDIYEETNTCDQEEAGKDESDEKNKYHNERPTRLRKHTHVSEENSNYEGDEASKSESDEKMKNYHKGKHSRSKDHKKTHGDEYEETAFVQEEASKNESEVNYKYQEKVEYFYKEKHSGRSRADKNVSKEKCHDNDDKYIKEEHQHRRSNPDRKKNDSSSKHKHSANQNDVKEDRSHKSSTREHRSSHHRSNRDNRDKHEEKELKNYGEGEKKLGVKNDDKERRKDKDKSKKNRDNCKPADKSRVHRRSADGDSSGTGDSRGLGSAASSGVTRSERSQNKEKSGPRSGGKGSSSSTSDAISTSVMLEDSQDYFEQNYVDETVIIFPTIDSIMDGNVVCHVQNGVSNNENNLKSNKVYVSRGDEDTQIFQEKREEGEKVDCDGPKEQEKEKYDMEKLGNDNEMKITLESERLQTSSNELGFQEVSEHPTISALTNLQENLDSSEKMENFEGQEKLNLNDQVEEKDFDVLVSDADAKEYGESNSLHENEAIFPANVNLETVVPTQNVETQLPLNEFRKKRFAANIAEVRKIMRERRRNERIQKKRLRLNDSVANDHSSMIDQKVDNQTAMDKNRLVETDNQVENSHECNKLISAMMLNESSVEVRAECTDEIVQNQDDPPASENNVNNFKYKRPKFAANIYEVRKIIKARRRLRRMEKKRFNTAKRDELNRSTAEYESKAYIEENEPNSFRDTCQNKHDDGSLESIPTNTRSQLERRVAKIVLNKLECDSTDNKTEKKTENLITLKIESQDCVESGSENFECKSSLSYQDINQLASKCLLVKIKKLDEDNSMKVANEISSNTKALNLSDDLEKSIIQDNNNENIVQIDNNCDTIEDCSSSITNGRKTSEDELNDLEVKQVKEADLSTHECQLENEVSSSANPITTQDENSYLYKDSKRSDEVLIYANPCPSSDDIKVTKVENSSTLETTCLADDVTVSSCEESEYDDNTPDVGTPETITKVDKITENHSSEKSKLAEDVGSFDTLETINSVDYIAGSEKPKSFEKVESLDSSETINKAVDTTESKKSKSFEKIECLNSSETINSVDDVTESEKSKSFEEVESSDSSETNNKVDYITEREKSKSVEELDNFDTSETIIKVDGITEIHSSERLKSAEEVTEGENLSSLKTIGLDVDLSESHTCEQSTSFNSPVVESSSLTKLIEFQDNGIEIRSRGGSKSPVQALKYCEIIAANKNFENENNDHIEFLNKDSSINDGFYYFEQNETDNSVEKLTKFKLFLNTYEKDYKYMKDIEKTDLVTSDFALDRKFDSYLEKECGFQVLRKDCILLPSLNDENYYFDKERSCYYLKNRLVDSCQMSKENHDVRLQKTSGKNRNVLRSDQNSECVEEKQSIRGKSIFREQRKSPVKLRISIRNPNSSVIETEEINVPYTSDVESSTDGSAGRISIDSRKSVEENEPNHCNEPVRVSTPLHDDKPFIIAESETVQLISGEVTQSENSFKNIKKKRGHSRRKRSSNSTHTETCHQDFKIKNSPENENNNLPSAEGAAHLSSFKITFSRNNSNLPRVIAPQSPSSQSNNLLVNKVLSSADAAVPSESESRLVVGKRHCSKTDSFDDSVRPPKKKCDSAFSDTDFKNMDQAIETVTDSLNNSFEDEADVSLDENMTSNMIGEALKNLIAESGLVTTTSQTSGYHETKVPARVTRQQRNQKMSNEPEDTVSPPKKIRNSERLSAGVKLPRRYENTDFYKPRLDHGQDNRRKRKPDEPVLDSLVDNEPPKKRKLSNVVGSARRRSR